MTLIRKPRPTTEVTRARTERPSAGLAGADPSASAVRSARAACPRRAPGTKRITAGSVRLEMTQVIRNTARKSDAVSVSSSPAIALPSELASDLAVKNDAANRQAIRVTIVGERRQLQRRHGGR